MKIEIIFLSQKNANNRFVVPYITRIYYSKFAAISILKFAILLSLYNIYSKSFYKGPDTAIIYLSNSENTIEDHANISIRNTASECASEYCTDKDVVSHRAVEKRRISARGRKTSYLAVYWRGTDRKSAEI